MKVIIETIPHAEQRYPTVGDWIVSHDNQFLTIRVSELGDWRKEMAVAYHELREALLCIHQGITQAEVDEFDIAFEETRKKHPEELKSKEPGDETYAPYYIPHIMASRDERLLIADFELNWDDYEKQINNL